MSDLLFQNLSTVQSDKQPLPYVLTAAATIAPQGFLTKLSGTTTVTTITPPVTGTHLIAIITGVVNDAFATSGNIVGLTTGNTTQPCLFIYDPLTSKYIRTVA